MARGRAVSAGEGGEQSAEGKGESFRVVVPLGYNRATLVPLVLKRFSEFTSEGVKLQLMREKHGLGARLLLRLVGHCVPKLLKLPPVPLLHAAPRAHRPLGGRRLRRGRVLAYFVK